MLCGLIKILSHTSAKKKTERLKGFKFRTFNGRFSSDIIAVKGLRALLPLAYIFLHPPTLHLNPPRTRPHSAATHTKQSTAPQKVEAPTAPIQTATCSVTYHHPVSQRRPVDKCFFLPRRTGSDFSRLSPCKGCPRVVVSGLSKDRMEGLTKKGFRARRL